MDVIRLGSDEFEGRTNAYLLRDDDTKALVDAGVGTATSLAQLEDGLAALGTDIAAVDALLLSHWHPDHAGLASDIQGESGATVYVHEADAPLVRKAAGPFQEMRERQREQFGAWGMPEEKLDELISRLESIAGIGGGAVDVDPIQDGDVVDLGGRTVEIVHVPGHTAGQCAFAFETDEGTDAFAGDVVLPDHTPNLGSDVRLDNPLERYLESLAVIADRDFDRLWPGHGDVIDDPADRIATIRDHHEARCDRVLDVLREYGPADPWTVAEHLFGDLQGVHIMHGATEAYSHLRHLHHHGVLESGSEEFRLVTDDPDLSALF